MYYVPNDSSVPLSWYDLHAFNWALIIALSFSVAIYSPAELLAIGKEDGSLKVLCKMCLLVCYIVFSFKR